MEWCEIVSTFGISYDLALFFAFQNLLSAYIGKKQSRSTLRSLPQVNNMILVIFDVDGTLVFSEKLDSKCFATTYQQVYDLPFPTIDWRKYPHVSDTTIFKTVIQEHFNRVATEAEEESFRQKFVANIIENRKNTPTEFKEVPFAKQTIDRLLACLLYTSPSPRDKRQSRMPSSA